MTPLSRHSACDYCGLPLPERWWGENTERAEEVQGYYCCLGCRIAAAIVDEKGEDGLSRTMLARLGLSVFFTMNVIAFTMALWTTDVYGDLEPAGRLAPVLNGLFRYLAALFSAPVLMLLGLPLFQHAWIGLRQGVLSTDWLLASGVIASFGISFLSVIRSQGGVYFEVGCVILVMTTLGRWLEATGKIKANAAIDALTKLLPDRVRRIRDGQEQMVPSDEVLVGDRVRVLAGERFPVDGWVVSHCGLVDEQVLTGESIPVLKQAGDRILGGTLNLDGDLAVHVAEVGEKGTLSRVVQLVKQARESKGRYQRLADRVSRRFVPLVSAVALVTFGLHWAFGSLEDGLWAGLAVVLIACPCALGLAAPLAVWSALGNAAGQRVLFRSGEALERLAEVGAIRFDKTGTLTTGSAAVADCVVEQPDEFVTVLLNAANLAAASSHAMSRGIVEFAAARHATPDRDAWDLRVVPGLGVVGSRPASHPSIALGSGRILTQNGLQAGPILSSALDDAKSRGQAVSLVGWDGLARGLFVFTEAWRPGACEVVRWLTRAGLDVAVLTGDHAARGKVIARELGITVATELMPAEKVDAIRFAQRTIGTVAMVGDGINDAPALSASDVGIALGCGTDLSRESAAICLLGDDLSRIPWSIELARRTRRVIRWNLIWAFGYNGVGVACAAMGWLNPALAAFLMVASGFLVTVNSLRLGRPFEVHLEAGEYSPVTPLPDSASTSPLLFPSLAAEELALPKRMTALEAATR